MWRLRILLKRPAPRASVGIVWELVQDVGTIASGKQCVAASKKLMYQLMESPTINVVGEKRG